MWRDPCEPATSVGPVILGLETSCDETARRSSRGDGEILVERRRLAGRAARALRRRRARGRVAAPPRARLAGRARGARRRPGRRSTTSTRSRSRRGRGSSARCSSASPRRRRSPGARGLPLVPVDHLHGHVASLYLAADRRRAAVPLPARERRAHAAARRAGPRPASACSARRSTTPPARRSTRARGCSGSAIRAAPRSTGSRARATPSAFDFPVARVPGLDFSFSGLKTALLYAVRDLGGELEARRADLAASLPARDRPRARRARPSRRPSGSGRADRRRRRRRRQLRARARAARGGRRAARAAAPTTRR